MKQFLSRLWRSYTRLFIPIASRDTAGSPQPATHLPDSYAVQCCRCLGFLATYGGVYHAAAHIPGWLTPGPIDWSRIAEYPTRTIANAQAKRHGWDVGDGTDRRCEICLSDIARGHSRGDRRGAIVRHGGQR